MLDEPPRPPGRPAGGCAGIEGVDDGLEFQETDLLGWGKSISLAYDQGSDRTTRSILFQDPYLFAPFFAGKLLYADNSDGRQRALEVSRPFYSFLTPWSADLSLQHVSEQERLYEDEEEFSTYRHEHRDRLYSYGHAIDARESEARRWTAGVDFVDDDFHNVDGHPFYVVRIA